MAFDTPINRSALISVFPDLATDVNFRVLSDCTWVYNCIAWAMGYTDRWVDHVVCAGHWWPNGVERNLKPETLIEAFKAEGLKYPRMEIWRRDIQRLCFTRKNHRKSGLTRLV